MTEEQTRKSTKAVGVVGLAVMCSRVLGLVREMVFAALFGAGRNLDAFLMAFRMPNLLRDLFAEGALSMAFVTTFTKKITTDGDASAWGLACKVATLTGVFMSFVSLVGIVAAPWIIAVLAPGFDSEKAALTVLLAQIMYPFILLVSLAALVMGMLNAKHIFGVPALASSFFNVGSIIAGVGLGWGLDPEFGTLSLVGLAIGTLVGGFLQLAFQLPTLFRTGFRFTADFAWRDDGVRQILRLMGPAVVAASAVQVNVLVNSIFASYLEDGAISWLQIAFRLMQLPLGIFGVAIATVTLPLISRSAAQGNMPEFRVFLSRGVRLAVVLTLPATLGLMLLAEPIISIIYERGRFTAMMTAQTAAGLQFYALGLIAYSCIKVVTPAFYALDKRLIPMVVGFVAIATNLLLNWFFTFQLGMGHRGLALSTGLVAAINFTVLYFLISKASGGLHTRTLAVLMLKLVVAGGLLAAVCYWGGQWWLAGWGEMAFIWKCLKLGSLIGAAGGVYFAAAVALRVDEARELMDLFMRRVGRR